MMEPLPNLDSLRFSQIEGLEVEMRHILSHRWSIERRSVDYLVRGSMHDGWRHELWRMVEFVAYDELVVLRAIVWPGASRCYEFVSAMKSGTAFRVYFLMEEQTSLAAEG